MRQSFDDSKPKSILAFAKSLEGKSIGQIAAERGLTFKRPKGKSGVGNIIERIMGKERDNESRPDFPKAGVELKTAPLNRHGGPKYPLTLGMIDFESIRKERWTGAKIRKKMERLLIIYYSEADDFLDSRVETATLWTPTANDWKVFAHDWESIKRKVVAGEPDTISESDTLLLVARRKGSKGEMRRVRYGKRTVEAPSRAFALRRTLLDVILKRARAEIGTEASLMTRLRVDDPSELMARIVIESMQYWGKTIDELREEFGGNSSRGAKSYAASVVYRALGLRKGEEHAKELLESGINVKTVRCNPGLRPIYAMSLRGFDYNDIITTEWEDSKAFEDVQRMLLVILLLPKRGAPQGKAILHSIIYHRPNTETLDTMRRDWLQAKRLVKAKKADKLTGAMGEILQTRPKASDGNDTVEAPGGIEVVKKGFFIRTDYLKKVIHGAFTRTD